MFLFTLFCVLAVITRVSLSAIWCGVGVTMHTIGNTYDLQDRMNKTVFVTTPDGEGEDILKTIIEARPALFRKLRSTLLVCLVWETVFVLLVLAAVNQFR
jgi:hypothetical protein